MVFYKISLLNNLTQTIFKSWFLFEILISMGNTLFYHIFFSVLKYNITYVMYLEYFMNFGFGSFFFIYLWKLVIQNRKWCTFRSFAKSGIMVSQKSTQYLRISFSPIINFIELRWLSVISSGDSSNFWSSSRTFKKAKNNPYFQFCWIFDLWVLYNPADIF